MEKECESESLKKEAWPCLRVPSLKGDTASLRPLCPSSVLAGLCPPWRLPPMFSLLNPSPRLRVLVLGLPGPPPNLCSSPSSGQDCENYITLLERQGDGLLVCGTNARRPSCWSVVRRPLPICLVSSPLSGWASAPHS